MKHLLRILVISLTVLSWITLCCAENATIPQIKDKILYKGGDERLDAIMEVDKHNFKEEDLIRLYMDLLDYYIGEAPGEVLREKITTMRDKILPFLIEKRNAPVECDEKYKEVCKEVRERKISERNVMIDPCINAIKNGVILYAVFPEKLEKEASKNMKIIRIFLEDFKASKGELPKDLKALRECAWQKYGYKLIILNPWGGAFDYLPKTRTEYILDVGKQGAD